MTNFEFIKEMDETELAAFIVGIEDDVKTGMSWEYEDICEDWLNKEYDANDDAWVLKFRRRE